MKAYVAVHGQTDLDAEGRIIGSDDPPLNDIGKQQALEAADNFMSKGIDMILASPQLRTMETAEIIADKIGFEKIKSQKD